MAKETEERGLQLRTADYIGEKGGELREAISGGEGDHGLGGGEVERA